ncbi:MAG: TetR/AcrR family transcriptional regulator [Fibrobacteres bacterium]|jgi:TetR/AcrR family transcriptional repressor of nem operon|nr:TetR/AcrR family transcriptional regulator [Fibrobacterota bacterium]
MLKADKWRSLTVAAGQLFHRQGYEQTSLADIASAANVPLGNVYYYFRTRDELLKAVVEERLKASRAKRTALEALASPRERLLALVAGFEEGVEDLTAYGCPMGSLCQETNKQGGETATEAAVPLRDLLEWVMMQFRAMGFREKEAREHAARLIGARQGSTLLANTFKDPNYIRMEIIRLKEWLSALPAPKERKKS